MDRKETPNLTTKNAFQYAGYGVFWIFALVAFLYPFIYPPSPLPSKDLPPVQPTDIPDFAKVTNVVEKKKAFFAYLLPEVQKQNQLVMEERHFLLSLEQKVQQQTVITQTQLDRLKSLAEKYKLDPETKLISLLTQLIKRVDIIPPELVLVQAANESAWGTSRFAQQGYNFFGLWCFKKGCGFVPARRTEGSAHEVARFRDLSHAVMTYIRNLNRHYAYEELRNIRQTLRQNQQQVTAEALAQGLMSYSERGQDYIDELLNMIQFNRKYMQV